jgi:hypothetical protein
MKKASMNDSTLYLEADRTGECLKIGIYGADDIIWRYDSQSVPIRDIDICSARIAETLNRQSRNRFDTYASVSGLISKGDYLAKTLLSETARNRLTTATEEFLLLKIDDGLVHIPWELICLDGRFLCMRFSVGRIVKTRQSLAKPICRPRRSPRKMWIVADPKNNLSVAEAEGEELFDALTDDEPVRIDPSLDSDLSPDHLAAQLPGYDIVHFAGHVHYETESPENSGWEMADGNFTAAHIDRIPAGSPMPSFVFSNACQSARTGEWNRDDLGDASFGLANAFLRKGVCHYLGTFWEITDTSGKQFSLKFYQHLTAGLPIGRVIRNLRNEMIETSADAGFLSYVLYGDPRTVYIEDASEDHAPVREKAKQVPAPMRGTSTTGRWFSLFRVNMERFGRQAVFAAATLVCITVLGFSGIGAYVYVHHQDNQIQSRKTDIRERVVDSEIEQAVRKSLEARVEQRRNRVKALWDEFVELCPVLTENGEKSLTVVLGAKNLPEDKRLRLSQVIQDKILYGQDIFMLLERQSFDLFLEFTLRRLKITAPEERRCNLQMPSHLVFVEKYDNCDNGECPVLMRMVEMETGELLISRFESLDETKPIPDQGIEITRKFIDELRRMFERKDVVVR